VKVLLDHADANTKLRRENCFDEGSRSKPHGGDAAAVALADVNLQDSQGQRL